MRLFATYLGINARPADAGELAILSRARIMGAGHGFPVVQCAARGGCSWAIPAALALGGLIGTTAVAVKHEIVLCIVGGLFVLEAVSVIVQVFSFKMTGRRVFRMAPIHHHFEQLGWSEPQIVIRFWIIAFVLALVGLSTLKVR